MTGSGLQIERRGPVGWLIFDRPHAANAMDAAMAAALPIAWRELDADPAVRCIVVTGSGNAFQTGLDVGALAKDPASLRELARRTRNADIQLTGWHLGVSTPIITAVNGVCAGGGLHFVVDSDIVIASERATFLDPHVSIGQVSSWEAIGLMRRMSGAAASRLALVGIHERLDAARAFELGLVGEVVPAEELERTAQRLGETIALNDPVAVRAAKRALWASMELGLGPARRLAMTASTSAAAPEESDDMTPSDADSLPTLVDLAGPTTTVDTAVEAVREWVATAIPQSWRAAGERDGPRGVRLVRTVDEYRDWYPDFGRSGLVAAGWDVSHGGLSWSRDVIKAVESVLAPYHLPRLNPLGLNLAAPALFAHGTEEQRRRFLPPIVRAEEIWCQLFSEPGAGSDLASLSTRAERDGDDWIITGQKIWTTWADQADFAVLLARTDLDVPKHQGITYFLIDMRQGAIDPRPLRAHGGRGRVLPGLHRRGTGTGLAAGRRDRRRVEGRAVDVERRAPDGLRRGLGRSRSGRRGQRRTADPPRADSRRRSPSGWLERAWRSRQADQAVVRGAGALMDQPAHQGAGRERTRTRSGELDRQGARLRPQPAHPGRCGGAARCFGHRLVGRSVGPGGLCEDDALRDQGDVAQPSQHDRRRDHRGQQDRTGRAGSRYAEGLRPVEGQALA